MQVSTKQFERVFLPIAATITAGASGLLSHELAGSLRAGGDDPINNLTSITFAGGLVATTLTGAGMLLHARSGSNMLLGGTLLGAAGLGGIAGGVVGRQ